MSETIVADTAAPALRRMENYLTRIKRSFDANHENNSSIRIWSCRVIAPTGLMRSFASDAIL